MRTSLPQGSTDKVRGSLYIEFCFICTPTRWLMEGSVAEWFRALDLSYGSPLLKSSTLLLSGIVHGCPEYNSSTALWKLVNLQPVGLMEVSVVEWFRTLDLKSGGPWLKSSTCC